jgi:hypothetical protein
LNKLPSNRHSYDYASSTFIRVAMISKSLIVSLHGEKIKLLKKKNGYTLTTANNHQGTQSPKKYNLLH